MRSAVAPAGGAISNSERPGEGGVVVTDDLEVDDQAGAFGSSVAKELADAVSHSGSLPMRDRNRRCVRSSDDRCGDDRSHDLACRFAGGFAGCLRVAVDRRTGLSGSFAAFAWSGRPVPHARQDVDASSVTPACGRPAETKKARYVVALSRVLRSCREPAPGGCALGRTAASGTG